MVMACPLSVTWECNQQARPVLHGSLEESTFIFLTIYNNKQIGDQTLQLHVNLYKIDKLQMIFLWFSRNANDFCSVEKILSKVTVYCPVGH